MALWSSLFVAAVVIVAVLLLRGGGGGGGGSSRFHSIHEFNTADYHSLAFSPAKEDVVLFGHHNGVQMSADGGQSWRPLIDQEGRDAMNLAYDPFTPQTVYMTGHNVYERSADGGQTWEPVNSNLPGLDLHAFAASPSKDGRLYAYAVGFGLYIDDGGRQWRLLSGDVPQGTNSILELPDGTLLLGAADAGILRSDDGGKTWTESRQGIETGVVFTVKGDPEGRRLYAGTNRGLFVSTDGGSSWSPTSLNDTIALVVGVDPSDPMAVLVVNSDGKLFRSRNGGASW